MIGIQFNSLEANILASSFPPCFTLHVNSNAIAFSPISLILFYALLNDHHIKRFQSKHRTTDKLEMVFRSRSVFFLSLL
jgi:hypothetical protein